MQTITSVPGKWTFVLGPDETPVASVRPGETFTVETADAFCDRIVSADQDLVEVVTIPYGNPVTGPIFVEGAEKGDTLALTLHSIEPTRDYGVSCIYPGFGGLCGSSFTRMLHEPLPPRLMIHPIRDGEITFSEELDIPSIPCATFYGTIGTAPELGAVPSVSPGPHGGNMDVPDVCAGNTLYLPVEVEGALLSMGDGHAAQGDGEICGSAVEVPTRGTITADLIKGQAISTPRIESSDYLMVIGNARPLEDATRIAFVELILWLEAEYGFERLMAYQLCSSVARVRLGNVVDSLYSAVAKFPKRYIPRSHR